MDPSRNLKRQSRALDQTFLDDFTVVQKTWEDINKDFTKQETVWNENGEVGKMTGRKRNGKEYTYYESKSAWQELVDDYEPSSEDYVHCDIQSIRRVKILSFNTQSEDISLFTRGMNSQTITSAREENSSLEPSVSNGVFTGNISDAMKSMSMIDASLFGASSKFGFNSSTTSTNDPLGSQCLVKKRTRVHPNTI